jgi:hypothetical protein
MEVREVRRAGLFSVPIGVTFSMEEPLYDLGHRGLTSVHLLEDLPAHPARGTRPDPVLLTAGQSPGQTLYVDRTDLTQLAGLADSLDRGGQLLVVLPEVVRDPHPGAVGVPLPVGVEVVDGVAHPAFGVDLRDISVDALQERIQGRARE